jgi:hypothetical protein
VVHGPETGEDLLLASHKVDKLAGNKEDSKEGKGEPLKAPKRRKITRAPKLKKADL